MRIFLTIIATLWISIASAQWGGGGGGTVNNTAANTNRVLCSIRTANFNTTADQTCSIPGTITAWNPTSVLVTNCSASLTLAAGGVYPAASKGGTAIVAAAQVYTALTAATIILPLTLATGNTRYTVSSVFLSLTTGQGTAATCDFYLIGNDLT
jgi:hypothetical protein